jgi:GH35 family endo-1,4-beta-xylanase
MLTGQNGQPFRLLPKVQRDGEAAIDTPDGKFEISMTLPVREFGQVYLYADNVGTLYELNDAGEVLLNYEFARSRAAFVRRYIEAAQSEGVVFSSGVTGRLNRGEAAVANATQAREIKPRVGYANDSLADTMWAGELAAVERARFHIARKGPRSGFLFGCNAFKYGKSKRYVRRFRDCFNFATLPFYRAVVETVEGKPDYRAVDAILDQMAGSGILGKGHPLVWTHSAGIPEFLKKKSWRELQQSCREYILGTVSRYRTHIHTWDVINEAHHLTDELRLDQEQMLELSRLAADTTRTADPTAFRVVNACCTWGEYAAAGGSDFGAGRQPMLTPFEYYKELEDAGVSYDAIGLQLYNPARDMLEIERQLERFFAFGKPVHVTELGVPSTKPRSKDSAAEGLWHGSGWTPQIQADWVAQFYSICYSKPQVQAVTWWDLADPAFIHDGGLLDAQFRPKEAYERLHGLIASWRG